MIFLQDPDDLKEVTTIMERLLRRSLSTILKRLFEIRKEKISLLKGPDDFKESTTID